MQCGAQFPRGLRARIDWLWFSAVRTRVRQPCRRPAQAGGPQVAMVIDVLIIRRLCLTQERRGGQGDAGCLVGPGHDRQALAKTIDREGCRPTDPRCTVAIWRKAQVFAHTLDRVQRCGPRRGYCPLYLVIEAATQAALSALAPRVLRPSRP